jgi:hypothetical protein
MAKIHKADDWGEFAQSTDVNNRSIIAASVGPGGSGKSHFWLTAPDPIAYFLFDPGGLKGLQENDLFSKKDIRVLDLSGLTDYGRIPKGERVKRALEIMDEKFNPSWDIAMQKAKTVVVDKEDALWEAIRYAHDEVDSPDPKSFGELNLQYKALFSQAERHGVNFGVIRGLKNEWGITGVSQRTGKPTMGFTGNFAPRGQKEVEELVQINLWHRWDNDQKEFIVTIKDKCRLGVAKDLLGQEFSDLDFLTLTSLLFPDSTPEEWGL